jgi:hypothetical protein
MHISFYFMGLSAAILAASLVDGQRLQNKMGTTTTTTKKPMTTVKATTTRPAQNPPVQGSINANIMCMSCGLNNTNRLGFFANPVDCHSFFRCQMLNETEVTGVLQRCSHGTFWDQAHLTCLAEGPTPCMPSPCSNAAIAALNCYQTPGQSCRQYFTCDNNATHCCANGTRFDPNTCGCLPDATCTDFCQEFPPIIAVAPVVINATHCTDAQGNLLSVVAGRPDLFGSDDTVLACAPGTTFELTTCTCSMEVNVSEPTTGGRQCHLWMPFETTLNDVSINKFTSLPIGSAVLDTTVSAPGSGTGSLLLGAGGRLEIAGLQSIDLDGQASFCAAFNCGGACNANAGVLSNSGNPDLSDYSFILGVLAGDSTWSTLDTSTMMVNLTGANTGTTSGWNTACFVFTGEAATLYINGVQAATSPASGLITINHCPYIVGFDYLLGGFVGHIDNVLICSTPLTATEVSNFNAGNTAALAAADLIPPSSVSGGSVGAIHGGN